jgi:hypothetical protein
MLPPPRESRTERSGLRAVNCERLRIECLLRSGQRGPVCRSAESSGFVFPPPVPAAEHRRPAPVRQARVYGNCVSPEGSNELKDSHMPLNHSSRPGFSQTPVTPVALAAAEPGCCCRS